MLLYYCDSKCCNDSLVFITREPFSTCVWVRLSGGMSCRLHNPSLSSNTSSCAAVYGAWSKTALNSCAQISHLYSHTQNKRIWNSVWICVTEFNVNPDRQCGLSLSVWIQYVWLQQQQWAFCNSNLTFLWEHKVLNQAVTQRLWKWA